MSNNCTFLIQSLLTQPLVLKNTFYEHKLIDQKLYLAFTYGNYINIY